VETLPVPLEAKVMLKKLWVFSKEEVTDEVKYDWKYFHMGYIELLEFISRVAIQLRPAGDTSSL
jgi:hypothetical protein